jgi:uncharacterized membrane protein YeiH
LSAPGLHLDWIIWGLDLAGVAVFAASGALAASRKQMDVIGFVLIATVTGIGGGTIRDLLLGIAPVFWITAPAYLLLCAAVAILLFFAAPFLQSRFRALLWADAAGLAVFCVIGAERALAAGAPMIVAVLMGMITATFGGLVRDVLCAEVPLILRREIYATAAAAGAAAYVGLHLLGISRPLTVLAAFFVGFAIRAVALAFGLSLPGYRSRPGRDYPDVRPE